MNGKGQERDTTVYRRLLNTEEAPSCFGAAFQPLVVEILSVNTEDHQILVHRAIPSGNITEAVRGHLDRTEPKADDIQRRARVFGVWKMFLCVKFIYLFSCGNSLRERTFNFEPKGLERHSGQKV